ncbi:hypothetical protein M9H77_30310 [Catharanthus roseus]|uniref:Uncharacterized protein n=1 Tax=Catharanthus roseus TaxID=4058 RepID=A0ACC0A154_CATRO|nr:hypothetical protein M9H77_30310 [Catharanthus roseus]
MALIMRKFKRFYKKGFNNRGKKPPLKKGGQSSSLFKARCFECNSTDHLVADCIALKANEDDQPYSSNNEDEVDDDEEMALIMRKFKRFYKKGFNNRGKKPPLKKGGQSSSLFKARCLNVIAPITS